MRCHIVMANRVSTAEAAELLQWVGGWVGGGGRVGGGARTALLWLLTSYMCSARFVKLHAPVVAMAHKRVPQYRSSYAIGTMPFRLLMLFRCPPKQNGPMPQADPVVMAKLRAASGLQFLANKKYKLAARKFAEVRSCGFLSVFVVLQSAVCLNESRC